MLRSDVAYQLGINIETIRYYEKQNLISKPKRLENGYRSYSKQQLIELKFIQHCRSLGISVSEIRTLKQLTNYSGDCSEAKVIIDKNLKLIEEKIRDLKSLEIQLKSLSDSCISTGAPKDCAIVRSLTNAAEGGGCICHG